jgi:hypothetical protein
VDFLLHHPNDHRKRNKVIGFCRSQWVCLEDRQDAVGQVRKAPDVITPEILPVVVMSDVHIDRPTSEKALQRVQNLHTPRSLDDREFGLDLPAESTRSIPKDWNAEAPFAVYETDDPLHS